MDGIRMLDEWPIIERVLPDHDTVLTKPNTAIDDEFAGDDIFGGFEKSNDILSKESIQILKLINGKRSIYEVIEYSGLGEFDTCKALVELIDKEYILKMTVPGEIRVGDITVPTEKSFTLPLKILKFSYIAIILALIVFYTQLTGTREIMNPRQSGFGGLKESFALSQVKMMENNLTLYYMDFGAYPATLSDLKNLDYVPTGDQVDPWGNTPSLIPAADNNLYVVSTGPDSSLNTQDDISSHP
jgi:hypothetical protein